MPESLEPGWPSIIMHVPNSSCLFTSQTLFHLTLCVSVPLEAMWLYMAFLMGLYYLLRWYQERQVVSRLQDKFVFITGCDSGTGASWPGSSTYEAWGSWLCVWWSGGPSKWGTRHQTGCRQWSWTSPRQRALLLPPVCEGTCVGQRYHPDFFCIYFFSQCEGEIPCQERFQGVFQDLKSHLPSSPHPADRGASFTPYSHLWPWSFAAWGRVSPDENVSLQTSHLVSSLLSAGLGFLMLSEQGDWGALPGGGEETGALVGRLHGAGAGGRGGAGLCSQPWSCSCWSPVVVLHEFKCHSFSDDGAAVRTCVKMVRKNYGVTFSSSFFVHTVLPVVYWWKEEH